MTNFVTIKEAKENSKRGIRNDSFIGVVIQQSEVYKGSSEGKSWLRRTFTIQDSSDTVIFTAWNNGVNLFKTGNKYEFINPYWSTYEGTIGLSLGKNGKVNLLQTEQTTIDKKSLPNINQDLADFTRTEITQLLQIKKEVYFHYENLFSDLNPAELSMYVKEIYREYKKSNIVKFNARKQTNF